MSLCSGICGGLLQTVLKKKKKKRAQDKFTKLKFYFLKNCYLYKLSDL